MNQSVRRVVTGHNEKGRSVILFDGPAPNAVPYPPGSGGCFTKLWATDGAPACNHGSYDNGDGPISIEPLPQGSGFFIAHIPPSETRELGVELTRMEREKMREGMKTIGAENSGVESERDPSMHRTRTIDYLIILTGEVTLVLDEGEVVLKPFDVVVQRGTSHAWRNTGSTEAIMAGVMLDAEPV